MSKGRYYQPMQGDAAHVTIKPTALEGGFMADPLDFQRITLLASIGQNVLATPKGLAMVWSIEPRTVAKALNAIRPTVSQSGTGYVRELNLDERVVESSCRSGATPDLSLTVRMGYRLPDGPVSLWRGRGLPKAVRDAVLARDGRVCAYCKTTDAKFHIDHIVPVAKGGSDDLSNLTVACQGCNLAKSDMSKEHFLEKHGMVR